MEESGSKPDILVLGMHRSGTSTVTGLISRLGYSLPPVELLGATPSNRSGHFEPRVLVEFHDRLLTHLESSWADSRKIPESIFETDPLEPFRRELTGIVSGWFGGTEPVVVKDPRMCRLLPLWRLVLDEIGVRPSVVLTYRNPLSVAESLASRDGFAPVAGLHMWLRHLLDAEAGSRGMRRSVVRYEGMIADWRSEMGRAFDQLGLDPIEGTEDESSHSFVNPREAHQAHSDAEIAISEIVPAGLRDLLTGTVEAHERLRTDPDDERAMAELDSLRRAFDEITLAAGELVFLHSNACSQLDQFKVREAAIAAEAAAFRETLNRMIASRSWRITAPLRGGWTWLGLK